MALDRNFFNSINLTPVRNKYYDISAVDNLLVDIRRQAEFINRRYTDMGEELEKAQEAREDYRRKGQVLSQEILSLREELEEARKRAEEAEEKAAALESMADNAGRHLPEDCEQLLSLQSMPAADSRVEEMYAAMKGIYASGLELLEKQWARYRADSALGEVPADLSSKVGKIASVLQEING